MGLGSERHQEGSWRRRRGWVMVAQARVLEVVTAPRARPRDAASAAVGCSSSVERPRLAPELGDGGDCV